jgi:hypothetical protein
MNIEIVGIRNPDDLERERIVMRALGDTDIGDYLILRTPTKEDVVRAGRLHDTYWFRDKQIRAGDLVVLYSKRGVAREKRNEDETVTHFFYWGLSQPCWSESNSAAVLVRIGEWASYFPEHLLSRPISDR